MSLADRCGLCHWCCSNTAAVLDPVWESVDVRERNDCARLGHAATS